MVLFTITTAVDVDPESLQQFVNSAKTSTAPQKVGTNLQNPVPKQKRAYKRTIVKTFRDYRSFCGLLDALKPFGPQLSRMKTVEEMRSLVPLLRQFKLQLLDKNFCENWMILYNKCPQKKSPHSLSMQTVAEGIRNGLVTKGSLIQYFGDFPTPPNDESDFVRFRDELKGLHRIGKLKYNQPQRHYITQRLSKIESDIAAVGKDVEAWATESSPIRKQPSATTATKRNGVTIRSHVVTHEPAKKCAKITPSPAPPSVQPISNGPSSAFAIFLKATPGMSKNKAYEAFSKLDAETRALFTNLAKADH